MLMEESKNEKSTMEVGIVSEETVQNKIYTVRGYKVMLDVDLAYSEIYGQAKKTIYVVDNYIGLRTLVLLKNAPAGVDITLFSDNVGNRLHKVEYNDFLRE